MAKIVKKSKGGRKSRTRTVTKVKRVYVSAKRKARKIRRAASASVSKKDIVLAVAGAGVGSVGSAVVLNKLPATIPVVAKNGIVAAAGGALAYYGIKKRNKMLMGAGLGMAAVGAKNLISTAVPTLAGVPRYNVLRAPIACTTPRLAAPYVNTPAPRLSAPFVRSMAAFSDEESI